MSYDKTREDMETMKDYTYKGFKFRVTNNVCANNMRALYEIDGLKEAGCRPFLTSISETKDFIREAVECGYWMDGNGNYHYLKTEK